MYRKIIFFCFLLVLTLSVAQRAFAQPTCPAGESYNEQKLGCFAVAQSQADTGGMNLESGTKSHVDATLQSFACGLAIPCKVQDFPTPGNPTGFINKTAAGQLAIGIQTMYVNPPANIALWVRDSGETLGFFPKSAYAQGTGFIGLAPLLGLWKGFRNVAYVLLALSIIVVSFMIMFRRKIDPKTVMTVQNALPRIIMALILITFSYAIASLLIDIMYIVTAMLSAIIASAFPSTNIQQEFQSTFVNGSFEDLARNVFAPLAMFKVEQNLAGAAALGGIAGIFSAGALAIPAAILGFIITSAVNSAPGGLMAPVLWFLFAIAIFFVFIRIFVMLLNAYIQVIISVIFAPFHILIDVFPGTNGFISWITNLMTNLLTFVIVSILLAIDSVVIQAMGKSPLWAPPLIGGVDSGLLQAVVGVGFMMAIPSIVGSIKETFKSKAAVQLGLGSGLQTPVSAGMQLISLSASLNQLTNGNLVKRFTGGNGDAHAKQH